MEVIPLASKQPLSNVLDVRDVIYLLEAFEELNSCILSVSFSLTRKAGKEDLKVEIVASSTRSANVDPARLASVNSSLSALNTLSMEGATMHALYLMDAELARIEMEAPQPK